jgi:hypothetical protein
MFTSPVALVIAVITSYNEASRRYSSPATPGHPVDLTGW